MKLKYEVEIYAKIGVSFMIPLKGLNYKTSTLEHALLNIGDHVTRAKIDYIFDDEAMVWLTTEMDRCDEVLETAKEIISDHIEKILSGYKDSVKKHNDECLKKIELINEKLK
jgi:hypothetical protein